MLVFIIFFVFFLFICFYGFGGSTSRRLVPSAAGLVAALRHQSNRSSGPSAAGESSSHSASQSPPVPDAHAR